MADSEDDIPLDQLILMKQKEDIKQEPGTKPKSPR